MNKVCPGASSIRQPRPELFDCPFCGEEVEIWTDELKAVCPNCKNTVTRSQDLSCLEWCRMARDCVGENAYSTYMANRAVSMKRKLVVELEEYFGPDRKRIEHARKVLHYAEELLKKEKGDWHIVVPASILHDVGIKAAERKHGSAAGHLQEKEGPPIARKILLKLGLRMEHIEQICDIIAHHHSPGEVDTLNFRVLSDADRLVNMQDQAKTVDDEEKLGRMIHKFFLTAEGKRLAEELYLSSSARRS